MRDDAGLLGESTVSLGDLRQARPARGRGSRAFENEGLAGRRLGVPVRHDLCAVGQSHEGARMARDGVAVAGPGPGMLKTDPVIVPLRQEPRFQAIERQLKFPN